MRQCAKLSAHAFIVCYAVDLGGKAAEQRFVRHNLERNRAVAVPCAQQAGQCAERLLLRLTGAAEYTQTLAVFAQLEQTELPDDLLSLILSEILVMRLSSAVTEVAQVFGTKFDISGLGFDECLLLLLVCSMIGWVAAWLATVQHLRHFTPD